MELCARLGICIGLELMTISFEEFNGLRIFGMSEWGKLKELI
jgi:hypothetical protein